jgi:hypothetical protein
MTPTDAEVRRSRCRRYSHRRRRLPLLEIVAEIFAISPLFRLATQNLVNPVRVGFEV